MAEFKHREQQHETHRLHHHAQRFQLCVLHCQVTAKASKAMRPDKTIGAGTVSTEYAGSGPQTVTLVDDDGNNVGEVWRDVRKPPCIGLWRSSRSRHSVPPGFASATDSVPEVAVCLPPWQWAAFSQRAAA